MAGQHPFLLDISRTVSRIARGPATGIDRVEAAYTDWALARPGSAFLCRLGQRAALIDAAAMPDLRCALADVAGARHWPLAKLMPGRLPRDRRAEGIVRSRALAVGRLANLGPALRRRFKGGFAYVNVGHTHLDPPRLAALRAAGAAKVVVLIHDVIPLDFPKTQTARSVETFRRRFGTAAAHADLLITSANATAADIARHLPQTSPPLKALPFGAVMPVDAAPFTSDRPYFVQLGTIEPRKNTALLLDVWEHLPTPRPALHLVGARGWLSGPLFARIEAMKDDVRLFHDLPDAAVTAQLKGARALLFPTIAEGYGFPLLEALALGTPVIASDLPIFKEIAPEGPLYLDPQDAKLWVKAITERASSSQVGRAVARDTSFALPGWPDHFRALDAIL